MEESKLKNTIAKLIKEVFEERENIGVITPDMDLSEHSPYEYNMPRNYRMVAETKKDSK